MDKKMERKDNKMVVYINSDRMGNGDDELGMKLINIFIATLADFVPDVSHITLVNSGVRLVCKESPALENMKMLENAGVEILSCGTCLDHFDLQEALEVGSRSNMFTILEAISKAEKVLTP